METIFITGTDTGVGKTYFGRILVKALLNNKYRCIPKKPIESGCEPKNGELIPDDALQYVGATNNSVSLEEVCKYRYEPPISPERAIRLAGEKVKVKDLVKACATDREADFLLVEGAGGIYSPLCLDGLNADLAVALQGKVILVVPDRLGCINQALLATEAIKSQHLELLAVVLNQYRPHDDTMMDNYADLKARLLVPVIRIPLIQSGDQELLDMQYNGIEEVLNILKALG